MSDAARPADGSFRYPLPTAARVGALALLALLAGWGVVALESLGPMLHRVSVVALAVSVPMLLLFLARPLRGLQLYLVLLPLVASGGVVAGLNLGELLTVAVVALGTASAWSLRDRIPAALSDLGPVLWPLAALGVVSIVSLVANGLTGPTHILSALFKIVGFAVVAFLVYLHADSGRAAKALLLAILVGALAEALYSIGEFALGLSYYESYGYNRASGTFSTWNHLGGFMALTSVPTLGFALYSKRPAVRWALIGAFVAEIVALLLSLTLGSVLGLIVGGLVAGTFIFRIPLRRIAMGVLAFGLVFGAVYAANPLLQDKVGRVEERVVDRLITYSVGVRMLGDRAWVGFGSQARVAETFLGSSEYAMTRWGESSVIPHASVLSIGVEKGIFGVVFFLLLLVGVVRVLLKQRKRFAGSRETLLFQGAVVGLVAFMVQDMTNNLLLHARLGMIFFALLAVLTALGAHVQRAAADAGADAGAEGVGA